MAYGNASKKLFCAIIFMMKQWSVLQFTRILRRNKTAIIVIFLACLLAVLFSVQAASKELSGKYAQLLSRSVGDRNGEIIFRDLNARGAYTRDGVIPEKLKELVLLKEDRWFYYHMGVNPWSYIRVATEYMMNNRGGGASTITEQLSKILLGNESARTLTNKFRELLAALTLELTHSKDEILDMYMRTAFLGNQAQGFPEASMRYYNKSIDSLDHSELFSLVATLSSPSAMNPLKKLHKSHAEILAEKLNLTWYKSPLLGKIWKHEEGAGAFELRTLLASCELQTCKSTVDQELTEKLRQAAKKMTDSTGLDGATNAAIVVLSLPSREILAMIGSTDTSSLVAGNQINMAISPRPIGSTIKPLIYERAFEAGLRPYTIVRDAEYRYDIATGFPLYPKNYDGKYHGNVTLEYSLANSLNVPAVKMLEYVGVNEFTQFLVNSIGFMPLQNIESYQYGIALGGLEMDLLTLVHILSLFGTDGEISPVTLWTGIHTGTSIALPPMATIVGRKKIADARFVGLINRILTDRSLSVEQFGLTGNLNISGKTVAVKTGTSRDYHDSWTIGWTPDFIVGVWMGNAKNTPLNNVSGSAGAGKLWNDTMGILLSSEYNKNTSFTYPDLIDYPTELGLLRGLRGDRVKEMRDSLLSQRLIHFPHQGDIFSLDSQTVITFRASVSVDWYINGKLLGSGVKYTYSPKQAGELSISAKRGAQEETLTITIISRD